jgi:hypothetical protein
MSHPLAHRPPSRKPGVTWRSLHRDAAVQVEYHLHVDVSVGGKKRVVRRLVAQFEHIVWLAKLKP